MNWFATWCGPCKAEMPHLKDRVWEAFKGNPDFVMISISREEDAAKVAPFVAERALPWTIGLDTDRAAYAPLCRGLHPAQPCDRARRAHRLPVGGVRGSGVRRHDHGHCRCPGGTLNAQVRKLDTVSRSLTARCVRARTEVWSPPGAAVSSPDSSRMFPLMLRRPSTAP